MFVVGVFRVCLMITILAGKQDDPGVRWLVFDEALSELKSPEADFTLVAWRPMTGLHVPTEAVAFIGLMATDCARCHLNLLMNSAIVKAQMLDNSTANLALLFVHSVHGSLVSS